MKKVLLFMVLLFSMSLAAKSEVFYLPNGTILNGQMYIYNGYYYLGTNYNNLFYCCDSNGTYGPRRVILAPYPNVVNYLNNCGIVVHKAVPAYMAYNDVWYLDTSGGSKICYPGGGFANINQSANPTVKYLPNLNGATSFVWR